MVSSSGSRSLLARLLWSPTGAAAFADEHVFLQRRVALYVQILFFFAAFVLFGMAGLAFVGCRRLSKRK